MKNEGLIKTVKSFGEVKSTGTRKASGRGIRFADLQTRDSYDEFFTERTVVGLENGTSRPYLLEHWKDELFQWLVVGMAVFEKSAEGWDYEVTFKDDDAGNKAYELISEGKYHSSGGSAWNYIKRKYVYTDMVEGYELLVWLLIEMSATLRPSDFFNPQIQIKSMQDSDWIMQVIAPLLKEREQLLDACNGYKSLEERILTLESSVKTSGDSGIVIPENFEEEIQNLLETANKYKGKIFPLTGV